jgi:hypothetical protein
MQNFVIINAFCPYFPFMGLADELSLPKIGGTLYSFQKAPQCATYDF